MPGLWIGTVIASHHKGKDDEHTRHHLIDTGESRQIVESDARRIVDYPIKSEELCYPVHFQSIIKRYLKPSVFLSGPCFLSNGIYDFQ